MSNPEPTRNYDAASFVVPSPSFVAVRYFKVRPTGAHLISRDGQPQSAEKVRTRKSRSADFYYAFRQRYILPADSCIQLEPKENSVKDQRRKKLSTVGPGVMFAYARDIRLSQQQKGEPLNYFIYPYAESNGQPIKGLTTHFAIRDLSPPALKTREIA